MSIVLHPGDGIHLALPGMVDHHGAPNVTANVELERQFRQFYADQGVNVLIVTVINTPRPVIPTVVAVFREEKKPVPLARESRRRGADNVCLECP